MNIAVLIGVSEYRVAAPLPACSADVLQMHRLLVATKKYDEICLLTTQTASGPLKDALRNFFIKYQKTTEMSEVLIYFTGHGVFHTDAMFCCTDYDPNRPATTSISNEELDDLLRSVAPSVAVKIIDACQSGSPYIKDASAGFEKALRDSRLNSFILMASSRQDQSSYATAEASAFTAKWIDAALYKQDGTILYRDIQAALADAFVNNPDQTPFFVSQGTGLEAFALVTDEMRRLAAERSKTVDIEKGEKATEDLIAQEIARRDAIYVSADDAFKAIEKSGNDLDIQVISNPLVARFYQKQVSRDAKLSGLPKSRGVAEFAKEQGWSKKYFVDVQEEQYRAKVPSNVWRVLGMGVASPREQTENFTTEVRYRPTHISSTQPLPFEVAEVMFVANNHPSLKAFTLYIGIVHSLTDVMVLSAVAGLSQKAWNIRAPELSEVQWRYKTYLWNEVVSQPKSIWEEAFTRVQDTIKAYLEGLLPKKEDSLLDKQVPPVEEASTGPNGSSKSK
jgi:hypothetical protein